MTHKKKLYDRSLLGFLCFLFISLWACKSRENNGKNILKNIIILVSDNFESQGINEFVKYSVNFKESELKRKNLRKYILNNFTPKLNNKEVSLGKASESNYGWVYFEIFNKTEHTQLLTFETVHLRCDGLEVYSLQNDSLKYLTSIKRQTPFSERSYPLLTFAIPVKIYANDTLGILVRSERYSGINELNLTLFKESQFIQNAYYDIPKTIFQIAFVCVTIFFMFSLGVIFKHKLLLYNSFFIFGILLAISTNSYLYDHIPFPKILTLNEFNIGSFITFAVNASYHPFGKELIKKLPFNQKRYRLWADILIVLNVVAMFATALIHHKIIALIPAIFTILTSISICWVLYHAILAILRARVYSYLIIFSLAFLPIISQNILSLFNIGKDIYRLDFRLFNTPLIIISLAYLSIDSFRRELISKENSSKNLNIMRQNIDKIRKNEVENIGRNLHDSVGNTLASALGYLNLKNVDIGVVKKLLTDSINEVRFLSHNLVKDDARPMREKIESLVNRFNDFSMINFQFIDFSESKIDQLELIKQNNIYMIIQEVMSNIIKHSKASESYIQIFEYAKFFQISIEDDGIGMKNDIGSMGIGIQNIYKRAELSELKIVIDSTPHGTSFIIEIPYENESNNH